MLKRSNLHDYQFTAVDHIKSVPRSALFLDMGLGKTVSTLTAISDLIFRDKEVQRVLIIGPKRVAQNVWINEVKEWEHLQNIRVQVLSGTPKKRLQQLQNDAEIYTISVDLVPWLCGLYGGLMLPFDMMVIDESSSFKNPKSNRFKALKRVMPSVERVVLLTGTPAPNSLRDLWAQVYLLDGGERLGKTMKVFTDAYFRTTNLGNFNKYEIRKGSKEAIYERIKDICISMKKEDYLDLQKPFFNYIRLKMDAKTKKLYEDFEREQILIMSEMAQMLGDSQIEVASAAALSNKLLQFSNGAVYDENRVPHLIHDAKLDALDEVIAEANGKPVLLAYSFQSDRDRILARYPFAKVLKNDDDIAAWNRGEIPLMIMHPKSGGHGLNIQKGGHIIVWFGINWSLELYEQFNARLDRQGQKETVIINHIINEGTLDEEVLEALNRKATDQNALMKAVKARVKKYLKDFLQ